MRDRGRSAARSPSTPARGRCSRTPERRRGEPPTLEQIDGTAVAYLAERMRRTDPAGPVTSAPQKTDIASYLHTGGTTDRPKLGVRTHSNEVANAWMIGCSDLLKEGSTVFAALPLFHTNALLVTVLEPLLKGQHVVWAGPLGYRDAHSSARSGSS